MAGQTGVPSSKGGGGSGQVVKSKLITQTAHGFAVDQIVYKSSVAGAYDLAQADSVTTAEAIGVVTGPITANTFYIESLGLHTITNAAFLPLPAEGSSGFLSATTAGAITYTEPTSPNVSQPIWTVTSANTVNVDIKRGVVASPNDPGVNFAKKRTFLRSDLSLLTATDMLEFANGQLVEVTGGTVIGDDEQGSTYRWDSTNTRAHTGIDVISVTASPTGRFIKKIEPTPYNVDKSRLLSFGGTPKLSSWTVQRAIGAVLSLHSYSHLGGPNWVRTRMGQSGVTTSPWEAESISIEQIFSYLHPWTAAAFAYPTGVWTNQLANAAMNTYLGGMARQATATGAQIDVTITLSEFSSVYSMFVGRLAGGIVRVRVNGGSTGVVVPVGASGDGEFDTYSATDLNYKSRVLIAQLPAGTYTISLQTATFKNAASSGFQHFFNAIAFHGENIHGQPSSADATTPVWVSGATYAVSQQVYNPATNTYYYANAITTGITGATAPTHTTGAVVDGGVTWTATPTSSYVVPSTLVHIPGSPTVSGSRVEYAYTIQPTGTITNEDVGGFAHGNETLLTVQYRLDGASVTPSKNVWLRGTFELNQTVRGWHSNVGAGYGPTVAVDLVNMTHSFRPGGFTVRHSHAWQFNATFGASSVFSYMAMLPVAYWDASLSKYSATQILSASDSKQFSAYNGVAGNPIVGNTREYWAAITGVAFIPNGAGAVPSVHPGTSQFMGVVSVDHESMDYEHAVGSTLLGKAMNTTGGTAPAVVSVNGKIYFERLPASVVAGEAWHCTSNYDFRVGALGSF
jgi:hypothetical protein